MKRVKVIEEIFETEKKYITCLDTVDKVGIFVLLSGGICYRNIYHLVLCLKALCFWQLVHQYNKVYFPGVGCGILWDLWGFFNKDTMV